MHIVQSKYSGRIMRYAAVVRVVRYMMVTSGRPSIAMKSHVLSKIGKWVQSGFSATKPFNPR